MAKVTKTKKPATEAKAATETKTAEPTKTEAINKGVTTGLRVMAYQDYTLSINDRKDRRLSDEQLAADWRKEFPNAKGRFDADIVRGVRRLFNAKKHGSQTTEPPDGGVKRYNEQGVVVDEVRRRRMTTAQASTQQQQHAEAAADQEPRRRLVRRKATA